MKGFERSTKKKQSEGFLKDLGELLVSCLLENSNMTSKSSHSVSAFKSRSHFGYNEIKQRFANFHM